MQFYFTIYKVSAVFLKINFKGNLWPILKENATVFPYSNMFFPQLRRVDAYLSRLSACALARGATMLAFSLAPFIL